MQGALVCGSLVKGMPDLDVMAACSFMDVTTWGGTVRRYCSRRSMFSRDRMPLSLMEGGGTGGETSPPRKGGKDAPLEVGATSLAHNEESTSDSRLWNKNGCIAQVRLHHIA